MENITQKITEELKAKVIEKLQPQILARDAGESKVKRLTEALDGYEETVGKLKEKVRVLNRKATEDLGEGKSIAKKRADLKTLREEMNEAEDLAQEIKDTALPDAKGLLKIAQDDLKVAVEATIAKCRGKYEEEMRQKLLDFMQIYDGWVAATRALYAEVRPGFIAGTASQVPRVICEPFKRYVEHIGLGIYEEVIKREPGEPGPTVEAKVTEEDKEEEAEPEIEAEVTEETQEAPANL